MIPPGSFLCPMCPDADNIWDASVWDPERGMCQACAREHPRRVRRKCSGKCGRTVETLDNVEAPMCRPCRHRLGNLKIPHKRVARRRYDRRRYQRRVMANQSGGAA